MTEQPPAQPDDDPRPLPLDSDIEAAETASGSPRPVHLRWRSIGLVFLGGTLGTATRYLVTEMIPPWIGLPVGTAVINITGAFALGVLLETLVRRGTDSGTRQMLRLLIGTGFLGGFTTYSALAVGTDTLLRSGDLPRALLYAGGTVLMGGVGTAAGIIVAARHHRRQRSRRHPPTERNGS